MERFNSIYPWTTENIAGYMNGLDLTNKKIITVTGSADHVINSIACGSKDITTFDINPLTKFYMDLKLAGLETLSYEEFLKVFLYDKSNLDIKLIESMNMPNDSKNFWIKQMLLFNNNWIQLKKSSLFNRKYFNPNSKLWQNIYLEKNKYEKVRQEVKETSINFINKNIIIIRITISQFFIY